jgi:2-hydroxychromene-2-carboxylate isomerase
MILENDLSPHIWTTPPRSIEFWFDFGSHYSYLSTMRIGQLARDAGLRVLWQPFLLGPIFKSFGWSSSPFVLQKEKGEYTWIDIARECRKYGLPWQQPTNFPRSGVLPMRVALLGQRTGQAWVEAFCQEVMLTNFARDRDIDDEALVAELLVQLGVDAKAVLAQAQAPENKLALREQTEEAVRRRIFGAPTFFVGREMFWGNDRLDDAIACASGR